MSEYEASEVPCDRCGALMLYGYECTVWWRFLLFKQDVEIRGNKAIGHMISMISFSGLCLLKHLEEIKWYI